jgi:hypothetical protein
MPHAAELLTEEVQARWWWLEVLAVEVVPVAKSCPNCRRRVGGGSKNLTRGITGWFTYIGIPAVVRSGAGKAQELSGVEREKGK